MYILSFDVLQAINSTTATAYPSTVLSFPMPLIARDQATRYFCSHLRNQINFRRQHFIGRAKWKRNSQLLATYTVHATSQKEHLTYDNV